jgi:uncharacterized membrane protein YtjA (UPF0391 family)
MLLGAKTGQAGSDSSKREVNFMKPWILFFAIVAFIALIFSFVGIPVYSGIAQVVFVILLVFIIVSLIVQYRGRRPERRGRS